MTSHWRAEPADSFHQAAQWYRDRVLADPLIEKFQTLKTQNICVMGSAGQVGSHLIGKCYELGFAPAQLLLNDNLSLGSLDNLPPSLRAQLDLRSHLDYATSPPQHLDILVFVGGRSSAPHFESLGDVLEEIKTWESILNWCVQDKIRLIFASTSSLCKQRPSLENQRVWPGSLYELCKLMMEEMAIERALDAGLQVQICRFFSVYGVTEAHKGQFGNLYTQLLWHAMEQTPFEVWGQRNRFEPGEQTRDIIFAAEVVRALLYLLTLPVPQPTLKDISGLIYNIGQGHPLTVNEMIEHVKTVVPQEQQPKVEEAEVPAILNNYVVNTWGDPSQLLLAGFQPLFTDNIENLRFIYASLKSDRREYWKLLETLRAELV